jgi:hypothetical protein
LKQNQQGDPAKAAEVIVDMIKGEGAAKKKPFPTVMALGSDSYAGIKEECESTLRRLEEWKDMSCSTDFN